MNPGTASFLKGLEGAVQPRLIDELKNILSGKVAPEGIAAALERLTGRLRGTAPPDPVEEVALARNWMRAPVNLSRRCWISRG